MNFPSSVMETGFPITLPSPCQHPNKPFMTEGTGVVPGSAARAAESVDTQTTAKMVSLFS
ncbi:hypothetical protein A0U89_00285 [Kozakia baliensis]|uniref:Uncharacterized protein n=1 Tax=Kozakia baliensis TaxID=153496 RepID=A0A1D8UQ97_9PROT|nr:hypothetical protein A0U89_00285 [Kozakia baliensis]